MIRNSMIFNRSPILPFWGWNAYTPVIPKLYYDCESAEQSLKNLWRSFDKLSHYASYIAETVNELDYATPNDLEILQNEINAKIYELEKLIREIIATENELIWNVCKGQFGTSIDSMRDMFNFVTSHSYRNSDLQNMSITVSQIANCGLNVEGWAICNEYYIKNKMSDVLPQYLY